ncbi:MAG: AI-2E family transporter [Eubacteriales bacterium]
MKADVKSFLKIGGVLFLLFLGFYYWETIEKGAVSLFAAAVPLLLGCVIAYLVNILMSWFERHYYPISSRRIVRITRRPVCLVAAVLSVLTISAFVIGLILPQLVDCVKLILDELPAAIDEFLAFVEKLNILPEDIFNFLDGIDWKSRILEILRGLTTGVSNVMGTVFKAVSSVVSGLVNTLIAVIFALYLLISRERIARQFKQLMHRYLRPKWCEKIMYGLTVLNDSFHKFIVGQCMEAVILGLLCTIGMSVFHFPYPAMIGALIAFTALIPVAGAYIGAGVGAFMILTVSPMQALLFLVFIVVLQQIEGNIIYPRVVGSSIGLPGIWVLAAVTIGGGVMGVAGMLIGVPLAAALYRILREDVKKEKPVQQTEEKQETNERKETQAS